MKLHIMKTGDSRVPSLLATLPVAAAAALFCCLPSAYAGGGGGGTPPDGTRNDEVTPLPMVAAQDSGALALIGNETAIGDLVRRVRGSGTVDVTTTQDGESLVQLTGDWSLGLSRSELASTDVRILFVIGDTYAGGSARLSIGGGKPTAFSLTDSTIELPLAALAGTDHQGMGWDLVAVSPEGQAVRNAAFFRTDTVFLAVRNSR